MPLPKKTTSLFYYCLVGLASLSVLSGVLVRLIALSYPNKAIFDEVYFPVFAENFLKGVQSFDVHPPLGKFLIALGILVFGNGPLGWRIVPALFGVGLIALFAWLAKTMFKDSVAAWVGLIIISLEGLFIVYSRTGLMDGVLLFFILTTFYLSLKAKRWRGLLGLAVLFGLTLSLKWLALGLGAPLLYVLWRRGKLLQGLCLLPVSIAVYLLIVLSGDWLGHVPHAWSAMLEWHNQALNYHLHLTATHPWSSTWVSWPFMLRPVLFFYETDAANNVRMITALGNPIFWWASTLAVIFSAAFLTVNAVLGSNKERRALLDHPLVPLLIGYFTFYLSWSGIHRVLFIYHYLPAYAFALLMLVYWLSKAWRRYPILVLLFLAVGIGVGIYYIPFVTGYPMSVTVFNHHLWLKSWL